MYPTHNLTYETSEMLGIGHLIFCIILCLQELYQQWYSPNSVDENMAWELS